VIRLEELTSTKLGRLVDSGTRTVVIPFGSLGAVLAPTFRVGFVDRRAGGRGTLSVPRKAVREVAVETARGLVADGFRVIALVSTHGGNRAPIEEAAQTLNDEYRYVVVCAPRGDVGPAPGAHRAGG